MEREIEWSARALQKLHNILEYLNVEWSEAISKKFEKDALNQIDLLKISPFIGTKTKRHNAFRKLVITKHNTLYYGIEKDKIVLLTFFDTRQYPQKNKYQ